MPTKINPKTSIIPSLNDFNETIDDVDKSVHAYLVSHKPILYYGSMIVCAVLVLMLLIFYAIYAREILATNGGPFFFVLIPLALPMGVYGYYQTKMASIFMQQLAAALGFKYQMVGDKKDLSSKVMHFYDASVFNVITGVYENNPMRIFNYAGSESFGRSVKIFLSTIFELTSSAVLPDIILLPIGKSSTIVGSLDGFKPMVLEGDFNKYFYLYVPKGSQIDVLEIFQPDFMAKLIDKYQSFGLEFTKDKFYIYPMKIISNKKDFLTTIDLVSDIYTEVLPTLSGMGADHNLE